MPQPAGLRIAMWSGPRNISTALLRSWGNRPDTVICDEPLYAHYLRQTGIQHPGREEVLASQENDWRKIVDWLTGPIPEAKAVFYQKHMAHHLLPHMERGWIDSLTNAFLIRDPREMLTSLWRIYPEAQLADTGLPQQWELFQRLRVRNDVPPPVIDSADVLADPAGVLAKLCQTLGISFSSAMLSWPPGPRRTDGVWAKYWYASVEQSTGFKPFKPKNEPIPPERRDVFQACQEIYDRLSACRLTA